MRPFSVRQAMKVLRLAVATAALSLVVFGTYAEDRFSQSPEAMSYDDAEKEIERLKAVQHALLEQVKRELSSIGALPAEKPNEPKSLRDRRSKMAQLKELLAEIEKRINEDPNDRTRYYSHKTTDPELRSYYQRLRDRIEREGTAGFPRESNNSLYGEVLLAMTIAQDGQLVGLEIIESTSEALSRHTTSLLNGMAPFEPFPPKLSLRASRLVIPEKFKYSHE